MYIKYDYFEMLEFFENEPISIGEDGAGEMIYSMQDDHQFKMVLMVDIYENKIDISINYNDDTIFSGEFGGVLEIRKDEDVILIDLEGEKRLVLKKYNCLGVFMENFL